MAKRDRTGRTIETPREATQAENSKGSLAVLAISLILAFIVGVGLFWYFGIWPFQHPIVPVQQG
jgi:hypothetical protein